MLLNVYFLNEKGYFWTSESLYTAGEIVGWYTHLGKQYAPIWLKLEGHAL